MHQETKEMLMQLNRWNLVRLIHLHTFNRASDLKWNGNFKNMSTEEVQELLILKELENTYLDHELRKLEDNYMQCDNCPHIVTKDMVNEAMDLVTVLITEQSRLSTIENRYKILRDHIMLEAELEHGDGTYDALRDMIEDIEGRLL